MAPYSRPTRRYRRIGTLLALLAIVLSMTAALPPAAAAVLSAATSVNAWQIDLTIAASGELHEPEIGVDASRLIAIHVSAQVRRTAHGWEAQPFSAIVVDDREERHTSRYYSSVAHEYIIDPDRYSRGPDPIWNLPGQFDPEQQADGSWLFPPEAFGLAFYLNGQLPREYTYRRDFRDSSQGAIPPSFNERGSYLVALLNTAYTRTRIPGIPGNTDGTTFALATTYQADEHGMVRSISVCL